METVTVAETAFRARLDEWRAALGLGHVAFARHLRISGPYWHQLWSRECPPSTPFMRRVIAAAAEPWRSVLIVARQEDQDTADRAALLAAGKLA